jgi:hypothetical protein
MFFDPPSRSGLPLFLPKLIREVHANNNDLSVTKYLKGFACPELATYFFR